MNEHVHPVFRSILNNVFAAAQTPKEYYTPTRNDDWEAFNHYDQLCHEQDANDEPLPESF